MNSGPSSARMGTVNTGRDFEESKGSGSRPNDTSGGQEETLGTFAANE